MANNMKRAKVCGSVFIGISVFHCPAAFRAAAGGDAEVLRCAVIGLGGQQCPRTLIFLGIFKVFGVRQYFTILELWGQQQTGRS